MDMKQGLVFKNLENEALSDGDLKQINRFSRRDLKKEELYVFSLILCDNEIDRDGEKFSVESLKKLGKMFVGKTGVFDHNPKGVNQTARIFSTEVDNDNLRHTKDDEVYHFLKAKAYMVRSAKTADLILEIDAGIKKEISIGCSVEKLVCSICGADRKKTPCQHKPGRTYEGKLCYGILTSPTDAYEWSFVAVPAQVNAGVVKKYIGSNRGLDEILGRFSDPGENLVLSPQEIEKTAKYIGLLHEKAAMGDIYQSEMKAELVKYALIAEPGLNPQVLRSVADKLDMDELRTFKSVYKGKVDRVLQPAPQLIAKKTEQHAAADNEFMI